MSTLRPLLRLVLSSRTHLFVLVLLALLLSAGINKGEFHFFGDEMRHAVTGVYFRDLMVDLPIRHPVRYTYEYFSKYPALGLVYWPPFFHFVEGIFFLVFGISVISSRLCILAFALTGAYFWYQIAARYGERHLALLSTLIFPLLPFMLTYERVTMLEIPMIGMCLAAIHYWLRFIDNERRLDLLIFAFLLSAALLTSQKSIFLAFFVVAHFLRKWRWRLLKRWDIWVAAVFSVAVVVPWYLLTFSRLALSYERVVGENFSHAARLLDLLYYVTLIPDQLGIVFTCLGGAGFLWALLRARQRYGLFLLWILVTYFCFTIVQEKSLRHTMIWIPPFVYFGLVALEVLLPKRTLALAAGGVIALVCAGNALIFEAPKIGGMDEVARYVTALPESEVLYFQGPLNGNFIFMVRRHDPEKRHLVAREKQVQAIRVFEAYGSRKIMETPDEFVNFVKTWGIRYVLLENREMFTGLGPVRGALLSGQFELVRVFPLWGNQHHLMDRRVYLYRFRGQLNRSSVPVVVPMMTIRRDIKVDLNRLAGRPWPN